MSKRWASPGVGLLVGCQVVAGLTDREAGPADASAGSGASAQDGGSTGATNSDAGAGGKMSTAQGGEGASGSPMTEGGRGGEGAASPEGGEGGADPGPVQKCTPNQPDCLDNTAVVCNSDGTDYLPEPEPCSAEQTCVAGQCEDHECEPNATFCSGSSLRKCADDGLSSSELMLCGSNQYCDTASASCKAGVCAPNQPACDDNRATTCNADGSGYEAGGTTCNASQSCDGGACKTHVCKPGSTFCTGQDLKTCAANGLSSSVQTTCSVSKTCVAVGDTASCAGVCGPTQTRCLANSIQVCNTGQWETTTACGNGKYCDGGGCVTCPGSTRNCDLNPDNACEIDLNSTNSCGTSCANDIACSSQNGAPSCTSGSCGISCNAGYGNCGGSNDGCETNLTNDPDNCDACGKVCSSNHMATRTCGNRTCNGTCATNYADCNSNKQTDGCEQRIDNDPNHCGGCNTPCTYRVCTSGTCVSSVLGNNQTSATTIKLAKNTLWAMKVNVPAAATLQALGVVVVVNAANPAANIRMGLYSDSGGSAPQSLEAQTPAFVTTDGVSERLLTSPVAISSGARWIAFVADQDVRVHADAATVAWTGATFSYASMPNNYPALTPYTIERGHVYAVTTP